MYLQGRDVVRGEGEKHKLTEGKDKKLCECMMSKRQKIAEKGAQSVAASLWDGEAQGQKQTVSFIFIVPGVIGLKKGCLLLNPHMRGL